MLLQGRKWLPKTGWAISSVERHCQRPATPSILPNTGWAIAHPNHPPLTPLYLICGNIQLQSTGCALNKASLKMKKKSGC